MPHPRFSISLPRHRPRQLQQFVSRRFLSRAPRQYSTPPSTPTVDPRAELERTLLDLQRFAPTYTNLPRLQLALQGLQQPSGCETIRVAILSNGSTSVGKDVARLLLTDPLKDAEEWESTLAENGAEPIMVRVSADEKEKKEAMEGEEGVLKAAELRLWKEIRVNAPTLRGHHVELLVMDANFPDMTDATQEQFEETVLVPMVHIPAANAERYLPIRTPVHSALLVGRGLMGAVKIMALPFQGIEDSVVAAVDFPAHTVKDEAADVPFKLIDIKTASHAVERFRQGPQHGIEYERLWHQSNLPFLTTWLKQAVCTPASSTTKPAVRGLISSVLKSTQSRITADEAQQAVQVSRLRVATLATPAARSLESALEEWAQKAHAELQDELDCAFTGKRWRMLGWWKLLWRVDDVGALTGEILAARYLNAAERELVYLAGRIRQAREEEPAYPQPSPPQSMETPNSASGKISAVTGASPKIATPESDTTNELSRISDAPRPTGPLSEWPQHISFTRTYISATTIPALQALAQKLVFQAYSTSTAMGCLAALIYTSSSLYEAGAVAALGIVFSLRRMQRKWDAAREFWEGEVREEGRKALRAAEKSMGDVLEARPDKVGEENVKLGEEERQRARELVENARSALQKMK